MPIDIFMPALSPTMEKGNLVKWCKKEGDKVSSGDVLAEIETDKAVMEVEVIDDGILGKILVQEGTEGVLVGTVIAVILQEGETMDDYAPSKAKAPTHAESPSPKKEAPKKDIAKQEPEEARVFITPLARRIAKMHGIDTTKIKGTGPHGRIIKEDVESYLKEGSGVTQKGGFKDIKMAGMRKVIAQRMTQAKRDVPHFYLSIDVDTSKLAQVRQQIVENIQKVTVTDFIIKACAKALIDVPEVNASFHDDFIRQYASADVALAISIEGGLITPILWGADTMPLLQISQKSKELAAKAKDGKLMPQDYQGGSFTISNLGMYGIVEFQAIINQPQVVILAVGATVNNIMRLTLSVDHRAVDGATAARFLQTLKKYLEAPALLTL